MNPKALLPVIGADMDVPLLRSLREGDEVLLEMNGSRVYSPPSLQSVCPLAGDGAWEVVQNDTVLRLKHPSIERVLALPYGTLVPATQSPAVFKIAESEYTKGPLYCIVQFVGHYLPADKLTEAFPNRFNETLCLESIEDDRVRVGLLEKWSSLLKDFRQNGFGYKSIKRLSLQSRTAERDLQAIRNEDWNAAVALPDTAMVNISRAFSWLPHYLRQASFIQHDFTTEYDPEVKDGKDSGACPHNGS